MWHRKELLGIAVCVLLVALLVAASYFSDEDGGFDCRTAAVDPGLKAQQTAQEQRRCADLAKVRTE